MSYKVTKLHGDTGYMGGENSARTDVHDYAGRRSRNHLTSAFAGLLRDKLALSRCGGGSVRAAGEDALEKLGNGVDVLRLSVEVNLVWERELLAEQVDALEGEALGRERLILDGDLLVVLAEPEFFRLRARTALTNLMGLLLQDATLLFVPELGQAQHKGGEFGLLGK